MNNQDFYIVDRETGAQSNNIPLWANQSANPARLIQNQNSQVSLKVIEQVPGAFQLLNVLSDEECQTLINIAESLQFNQDAAVSLPRHIRHNDSLTWVIDEKTEAIIWNRCKDVMANGIEAIAGLAPVGINARFRFYKYSKGDFFKPHTDGAWPGSKIIDGKNIFNAYQDRYSQMTFLILLSEDFQGGDTQFFVEKEQINQKPVNIRTPAGGVLCFPHGHHPLHCLHSSETITQGTKYIIRTDLLFPL